MGRHEWLSAGRDPASWLGDLTPLRRSHDHRSYAAEAAASGVVASVHVEAGWDPTDPVGETRWLLERAQDDAFPAAIVASARLAEPDVVETLDRQLELGRVRGVREMLNWDPDPARSPAPRDGMWGERAWRKGLSLVADRGLAFDLQVFWHQLSDAASLPREVPDVSFVLDHAGMPVDRSAGAMEVWADGMREMASAANVTVKLSGLAMPSGWDGAHAREVVARALDLFGPGRCMFGSNYPVETLWMSFAEQVRALDALLSELLGPHEQDLVWRGTAARVYGLDV
jgi:predicted TIM-barrel fold metal-dependent hydrolase